MTKSLLLTTALVLIGASQSAQAVLFTREHLSDCVNPSHMALTFDDGPCEHTPAILDFLKTNNLKATFFLLGREAEKHPDLVKRIYNEGHLIGSHSYSHPSFVRGHIDANGNAINGSITFQALMDEIVKTDNVIKSLTGVVPKFFRYPYSEFNTYTDAVVVRAAKKIPVFWNVDPKDYQTNDIPTLVSNFGSDLENNNKTRGYIAFMHDVYKHSVDALPQIYNNIIRSKNVQCVTVGQCANLDASQWYVTNPSYASATETPMVVYARGATPTATPVVTPIVTPVATPTQEPIRYISLPEGVFEEICEDIVESNSTSTTTTTTTSANAINSFGNGYAMAKSSAVVNTQVVTVVGSLVAGIVSAMLFM